MARSALVFPFAWRSLLVTLHSYVFCWSSLNNALLTNIKHHPPPVTMEISFCPLRHLMQPIEQVASDEVIEQTLLWTCLKRKEHFHNNDVWNLKRNWKTVKPDLQKQLLDGAYQFSPQQEIRFKNETIELWASLDALVWKSITLVLI